MSFEARLLSRLQTQQASGSTTTMFGIALVPPPHNIKSEIVRVKCAIITGLHCILNTQANIQSNAYKQGV